MPAADQQVKGACFLTNRDINEAFRKAKGPFTDLINQKTVNQTNEKM